MIPVHHFPGKVTCKGCGGPKHEVMKMSAHWWECRNPECPVVKAAALAEAEQEKETEAFMDRVAQRAKERL